MMNEPEGSDYKDKIRTKAYPAYEVGGLVWAYMGPADKKPPPPLFVLLRRLVEDDSCESHTPSSSDNSEAFPPAAVVSVEKLRSVAKRFK